MVFLAGSRGSRMIVWRIPVTYYIVFLAGIRGSRAAHLPPVYIRYLSWANSSAESESTHALQQLKPKLLRNCEIVNDG